MKREDIPVLDKNPYPNTFQDCSRILSRILSAIRKEPTLQIIDKKLFDDLMEYENHPSLIGSFFFEHNIEDVSYFKCRHVIAKNSDGELLIFDRNIQGQFIEVRVPIGFWEPYIRFGLTYITNQHRYHYYMTENVYIEYYDSFTSKGNARKMKIKSAFGWETTHCDENGQSNPVTNFVGMVNDFLDIFR